MKPKLLRTVRRTLRPESIEYVTLDLKSRANLVSVPMPTSWTHTSPTHHTECECPLCNGSGTQ